MAARFPAKADVPTIEDQRKLLTQQLENLRLLVANLPSGPGLPAGLPDGPLQQYFGTVDIDEDEGPWFTVNHA